MTLASLLGLILGCLLVVVLVAESERVSIGALLLAILYFLAVLVAATTGLISIS